MKLWSQINTRITIFVKCFSFIKTFLSNFFTETFFVSLFDLYTFLCRGKAAYYQHKER